MLNLAFGSWPIAVPNSLYEYWRPHQAWAGNNNILDAIAVILAAIQLLVVYIMQGSPGLVIIGLRVETPEGNRPSLPVVVGRAIPYLVGVVVMRLLWRYSANAVLGALFSWALVVVVILIVISGTVAAFSGRSLMDTLTNTVVTKAYTARSDHNYANAQVKRLD